MIHVQGPCQSNVPFKAAPFFIVCFEVIGIGMESEMRPFWEMAILVLALSSLIEGADALLVVHHTYCATQTH
jgi:hypothetical protein